MVPYLKGRHLTRKSWRGDHDDDGWKMTPKQEWAVMKEQMDDNSKLVKYDHAESNPPERVPIVAQFKDDVLALSEFTKSSTPPQALVRPNRAGTVAIMFGDASGTGFGTSLWVQNKPHIETEHGVWTGKYGNKSSNFRELYNLVARVVDLVEGKTLRPGTELFVFTDHSPAEAAFHKGTSKSKLLFELVLKLKVLEMAGNIFLNLVWVAGTQMIAQGTDGLSRGALLNGVLSGLDMLQFVPLNWTAEKLANFFIDAISDSMTFELLDPTGWFEWALTKGDFIWMPPPAAADVAVEKLCESKHIRPETSHILICPALMSCRWRKKLGRFLLCLS
ncbi:hypothetical protein ACA910_011468 [Epithemia clementina (nom. ined.)]